MSKRLSIKRETFFYTFLLLLPWMNVISNRISGSLNLIIIILLILLTIILFKKKDKKLNNQNITFYIVLQIILIMLTIIYKILLYGNINFNVYIVFCFNYFILFIFLHLIDIKSFLDKYLFFYINYILTISFIAIVIGHIVLYTDIPDTWQLLYRAGMGHDYFNRPFGLFGQPSINIGVVLFLYLTRLYMIDTQKIQISKKNKIIYSIMLLLTVVFQKSGTGILGYFIILIFLFSRNKLLMFFIMIPLVMVVLFIYFTYQEELIFTYKILSHKISIDYISANLIYFYQDIIEPYFMNLTFLDLLFGIDDARNIAIDFGPIYVIGKIGLLYTSVMIIYILHLMIKAKNFYFNLSIFVLFFIGLHYPVLIYPIPFIFFLLFGIYMTPTKYTKYKKVSQ